MFNYSAFQSRLHSSHSQNSVLYSEHEDDYDFKAVLDNIIFNHSFYKEKELVVSENQEKKERFLSLDFVQKYFNFHSIEPIMSKVIKAVLDSEYLPENPFNTIYRLLTLNTLLTNAFHFYNLAKDPVKRINADTKPLQIHTKLQKQPTSNQPWMQEILTRRVIIVEKEFFVGSKMVKYLNSNALYYTWGEIGSKQRMATINKLVKKHQLTSFYMSLGGPSLLALEGSATHSKDSQFIKLSLKTSEPISLSSYSESMLEVGYYVTVKEDEPGAVLTNFVNFVIEDSLQEMQQNPNEAYLFLTKLAVEFGEKEAVVEWSTQQLVEQKVNIIKYLVKLLLSQHCHLTTQYYLKPTKKLSSTLLVEHLTVTKTYILISPLPSSSPNTNNNSTTSISIYTNSPLSFMFEHCFVEPHYYQALDKAFGLNSIENQQIYKGYRKEKFRKVLQQLKLHLLVNAGRQLFFLSLYDMSLTPMSAQNITDALSLVMSSPLAFLSKLVHQFKTCKVILHPTASSLTANCQVFLYKTLQQIEQVVFQMEREGDAPYGEVIVAVQCLRKILAVLLTKERFRVNVIKLLLDYAILSLRGVINSYLTLAWSSSDTLHEYIISLNKSLATQTSTSTLQSIITHAQYLTKAKSMPEKTIKINEEVRKYKQDFETTEREMRDLIMAKYLQSYRVYEIVYGLYWELVEGKKLNYPLSKITEAFRARALHTQVGLMSQETLRLNKRNQTNPNTRTRLNVNRISGIEIYEMFGGINNETTFYAFSRESLSPTTITQYSKLYIKLLPYFQQVDTHPNLPLHYLLSLKHLPFMNNFSQQSSGIFISTFYADIIVRRPLKKQELVTVLYNEITQFMEQVDRDEVGIVGMYAAWRNLGNASLVYHGDSDQVYAQAAFDGTSLIKFDYKRKMPFDQFYKFLEHCITAGKQIQVRLIYKEQKIIQSSNIIFNMYFCHEQSTSLRSIQMKGEDNLKPIIEIGSWEDRVFSTSRDIIQWGVMNRVAVRKDAKRETQLGSGQGASPQKGRQATSKVITPSTHKILLQQQVLIEQLILEQQPSANNALRLTPSILRELSPTYTHLQQSHHHLLTLLYLLTYIKHDRRNRFELPLILDQVALVDYYLMERCLKNDRFIVLEGLAVQVANLLTAVREYLKQRQDNLGMEWEVIWVEKVVCRITGLVKMLMVSVTAEISKYNNFKEPSREK